MIEQDLAITNKLGLHARAAAKVVSVASRYSCSIQVIHGERRIDAKSIMGLMMLAATQGTRLTLVVEGEDSQQAVNRIVELFSDRFGEEE